MSQIDLDDAFQNTDDYQDSKIRWAWSEGFTQCPSCDDWYEDKSDFVGTMCNLCNAHFVSDEINAGEVFFESNKS